MEKVSKIEKPTDISGPIDNENQELPLTESEKKVQELLKNTNQQAKNEIDYLEGLDKEGGHKAENVGKKDKTAFEKTKKWLVGAMVGISFSAALGTLPDEALAQSREVRKFNQEMRDNIERALLGKTIKQIEEEDRMKKQVLMVERRKIQKILHDIRNSDLPAVEKVRQSKFYLDQLHEIENYIKTH